MSTKEPPDSHLTKGQYEHGFGMHKNRPFVGKLLQRYRLTPFSVWNTREGKWQNRRRLWLKKGIRSELGRKDKLTFNIPVTLRDGATGARYENETSVFDPVVCELAYRWWCPPGGVVLDPFAGGSVRGIVASVMGMRYLGIELSAAQVEANRAQITEETRGDYPPKWRCGDSYQVLHKAPPCDFFFSCPPYGNLEVYSDDPNDISNMPYDRFMERYTHIINTGVGKLKDNRFACFVVANYRDRDNTGKHMLDFVGDTVRAFTAAGAAFYNEVILVNSVGTGAMRSNGSFDRGSRKMVKCHQNILVFIKGCPVKAGAEIPVVENEEIEEST